MKEFGILLETLTEPAELAKHAGIWQTVRNLHWKDVILPEVIILAQLWFPVILHAGSAQIDPKYNKRPSSNRSIFSFMVREADDETSIQDKAGLEDHNLALEQSTAALIG